MTLTDEIAKAILATLQLRRPIIDNTEFLSSVTVTVRLQEGPVRVRAVTYEDQTQVARGARRTDT